MRALSLAPLLALALGAPAAEACTLLVPAGGTLALSAGGTRLGSGEPGGVAGSITLISLFNSTVTIGAPVLQQAPPGFSAAGAVVEVSYSGLGGLSFVQQAYTTAQTSFEVSGIASATLVSIDNRITSPAGFAAGTYQTRTLVTCS